MEVQNQRCASHRQSTGSRPRLREIHNIDDLRLTNEKNHRGSPTINSRAFCKTTFVNSTRWVSELRRMDSLPYYDTYSHENTTLELCRSKSAHLPRQRTIDTARPRRSVSWAEDLVNVHTYAKPKQRRQSGWQILRRKMSQVMRAIKEDIDF